MPLAVSTSRVSLQSSNRSQGLAMDLESEGWKGKMRRKTYDALRSLDKAFPEADLERVIYICR